jgi:hypothetical protein
VTTMKHGEWLQYPARGTSAQYAQTQSLQMQLEMGGHTTEQTLRFRSLGKFSLTETTYNPMKLNSSKWHLKT